MTRNLLTKVKESSIYPDELMANISRSTLGRTFVLSLIIHLAVIGLTSIRFAGLCIQYNTLQPREQIRAEKAEARRQELIAEAEKRASAGRKAGTQEGGGADPATGTDGDTKSPIEKTLEETSTERPTGSNVTFGEVDDLE